MKRVYLPILFVVSVVFFGSFSLPISSKTDLASSTLVLLVMCGVYVADSYEVDRETLTVDGYLLPVAIFFGAGFVSLLGATRYFGMMRVGLGFMYLVNFCLYLSAPPIIANHIRSDRQAQHLLAAGFLTTLIMMAGLLLMVATDFRFHPHTITIAGHEPLDWYWEQSQLALGMFLAANVSIAAALVLGTDWEVKERLLLLVVVIFGSFLTLATLSRSSILALVVGLFVVLVTYRRRLLTVIPVLSLIFPEYVIRRLQRTFSPTYVPELDVTIPISMSRRVVKWSLQIEIFSGNLLIGTGFALERFRALQLLGHRVAPDNQYVGLLAGTGLVGFVCFSYWVLYNVRVLAALSESSFDRAYSIGVFGAFLGFLAWGLFQGFYARTRVLGLLVVYLGVAWYHFQNDTTRRTDPIWSDSDS